MKRCPACGTDYSVAQGFCPMDGAPLTDLGENPVGNTAAGGRSSQPASPSGWDPPRTARTTTEARVVPVTDIGTTIPPLLVGGPARVSTGAALHVDPAETGTALVPPMAESSPRTASVAASVPARTVMAMVPPSARMAALRPSDPRPTPIGDSRPSNEPTLPPITESTPQTSMSSRLIQAEPGTVTGSDGQQVEGAFFPVGGLSRPKSEPSTSTTAWEDSLVGRVLDQRYRIDARIGAGAMGVVYKATHVIIDKPLAIKMLRTDVANQPDIIKRFLLEAQLASKVKHPNVVDISDYGQIAGQTAYYVMEYLTGTTLAARIDDRGRMDPALAVDIALQTGLALQAAHANKIIHRDLKSENIFLVDRPDTGETQVKILDFGIARIRDKRTRLTANGALIGSPAYMSPEQAQGHEVDERSDLYALGVILFEMLAGRVPFKAATVALVLSAQIFDAPPTLREIEPTVPELPNLEHVIRLLLAKNRDERPSDVGEVMHLIKTAAELDLAVETPATSLTNNKRRATVTIGSWSVADGPPVGLVRTDASPISAAAGESRTTPYPPPGELDAMMPRKVSASGRIQRRPSVIVPSGTHVERIAAPPPRATPDNPEGRHYPTGLLPAVRPAGPPMVLIIAAAASIGAAITVTLYKQVWRKPPAPVYAQQDTARPEPVPVAVNRISFDSDPPGATVIGANNEVWGVTPFGRDLVATGPRVQVVFKLQGHDDASVVVVPSEPERHKLHLRRSLVVPPPPTPETVVPTPVDPPAVATSDPPKPKPRPTKVKEDPPPIVPPETKAAATPATPPSEELDMGELKNPFRKK